MSQASENWEEYQKYLERARKHFKELENGNVEFSLQPKRSFLSSIKEHQGAVTFLIIMILLVNLFVVIPIITRQLNDSPLNDGNYTSKLPGTNHSKEYLPNWKTLFRISRSMTALPHYVLDGTLNGSKPLSLLDVPQAAWLLANEELFIEHEIINNTSLALLTSYLEKYELKWDDLEAKGLSDTTTRVLSNLSTEELAWMAFTINTFLVRRNADNITITFNTENSSVTSTVALSRTLTNLLNYIRDTRIHSNLTLALEHPLSDDKGNNTLVLRARTQLLLVWLFLDTSRAMDYVNFNPIAEKMFKYFVDHYFVILGPQNNYEAVVSQLRLVNASKVETASNESIVWDQLLAYYLSDRFWKITSNITYLEHRVLAGDFLLNTFITENYSVHSRIKLDSLTPLSSVFVTNDHLWAIIFYFLTGQYGIADNIRTNVLNHSYNSTIGLIRSCFSCDESSYALFDQMLIKFADNANASFLVTPTVSESAYISVITGTESLAQERYALGGMVGIDVFSSILIITLALVTTFAVRARKKKRLEKKNINC